MSRAFSLYFSQNRFSGGKSFNFPDISFKCVCNSVMQTMFPLLPEFKPDRIESESSPIRRPVDRFIFEFIPEIVEFVFKIFSVWNNRALFASPDRYIIFSRTGYKVRIRFLFGNPLNSSFNPDLPIRFRPVKKKSCIRISLNMFSFFAVVVSKKNKTLIITILFFLFSIPLYIR